MKTPDGYVPSSEEVKKAEEMVWDVADKKQAWHRNAMSSDREKLLSQVEASDKLWAAEEVDAKELSPDKIQELIAAIQKALQQEDRSFLEFLDTVGSLEELVQMRKYLRSHSEIYPQNDDGLPAEYSYLEDLLWFDKYKKFLTSIPDPEKELPENFRTEYPLISGKLDTPEKTRVFVRAFYDCKSPEFKDAAKSMESIIKAHEVEGINSIYIKSIVDEFSRHPVNPLFHVLDTWGHGDFRHQILQDALFPGLKTVITHGAPTPGPNDKIIANNLNNTYQFKKIHFLQLIWE